MEREAGTGKVLTGRILPMIALLFCVPVGILFVSVATGARPIAPCRRVEDLGDIFTEDFAVSHSEPTVTPNVKTAVAIASVRAGGIASR